MPAREIKAHVVSSQWLTPTVVTVRFRASRILNFQGGQFLSIVVPPSGSRTKPLKRAYSFASAPGTSEFELCVKYVRGGVGSEFIKGLKPGDEIRAFLPYGEFVYEPKAGRSACFIGTGTGIAPIRSIVTSRIFQENPPDSTLVLFGSRDEKEILYPGFFQSLGIETVVALSQPKTEWTGFRGRVTDYLESLPHHWNWHATDFYLCGNPKMIDHVVRLITSAHGVPDHHIFREAFTPPEALFKKAA